MTPTPEDIEALDHERAARSKALMSAAVVLEKVPAPRIGELSSWGTEDMITLAAWIIDGAQLIRPRTLMLPDGAHTALAPLYSGHADDDLESDKP